MNIEFYKHHDLSESLYQYDLNDKYIKNIINKKTKQKKL